MHNGRAAVVNPVESRGLSHEPKMHGLTSPTIIE